MFQNKENPINISPTQIAKHNMVKIFFDTDAMKTITQIQDNASCHIVKHAPGCAFCSRYGY